MELRIVHTTGFEYDGKAEASYNQARMTPLTGPGQIVVHTRLQVTPTPWIHDYRDYFGNDVTAFEVLDPHDSMTVTATSTVHTSRESAPPPTLAWADLADPGVEDRWTEYLSLPRLVAPPPGGTRRRTQRRWTGPASPHGWKPIRATVPHSIRSRSSTRPSIGTARRYVSPSTTDLRTAFPKRKPPKSRRL